MGKKKNKLTTWVKNFIYKLDELFAKWFNAPLEPKLYSVIGFSLIASVALSAIAMICQACEVNGTVISAIFITGAVLLFGYIIKMLLSNIKLIESVLMKILYVILNFAVVFIAGAITGYAITAVIALIVLYLTLMVFLGSIGGDTGSGGTDALGRKHVATLSNGVKIYKGSDMIGNSYYRGSDGNDYEPCSGGYIRK